MTPLRSVILLPAFLISGRQIDHLLGRWGYWLVFAIVLYLRYGFHLRGRRVALLTIMAFALLLLTLVTQHTFTVGGGP